MPPDDTTKCNLDCAGFTAMRRVLEYQFDIDKFKIDILRMSAMPNLTEFQRATINKFNAEIQMLVCLINEMYYQYEGLEEAMALIS